MVLSTVNSPNIGVKKTPTKNGELLKKLSGFKPKWRKHICKAAKNLSLARDEIVALEYTRHASGLVDCITVLLDEVRQ